MGQVWFYKSREMQMWKYENIVITEIFIILFANISLTSTQSALMTVPINFTLIEVLTGQITVTKSPAGISLSIPAKQSGMIKLTSTQSPPSTFMVVLHYLLWKFLYRLPSWDELKIHHSKRNPVLVLKMFVLVIGRKIDTVPKHVFLLFIRTWRSTC